jgi:hypothetical protein
VYPKWAPIGAQRFLDMVHDKFFSSKIAMFRALKGFLVQFGLSGDPEIQRQWHRRGNLKDDPSWLPLGIVVTSAFYTPLTVFKNIFYQVPRIEKEMAPRGFRRDILPMPGVARTQGAPLVILPTPCSVYFQAYT